MKKANARFLAACSIAILIYIVTVIIVSSIAANLTPLNEVRAPEYSPFNHPWILLAVGCAEIATIIGMIMGGEFPMPDFSSQSDKLPKAKTVKRDLDV